MPSRYDGRLARLPRLRKSLTVNALALMTATIAASALGLVFWAVAAHLRAPSVVGQASAGVAALTLLAMIAQLNLTNVIVRLLPAAGRLGDSLVRRGYLAVVALSLVGGIVYCVSGLGRHVVTGGWAHAAEFTLAVPVLAVFALEDSVLTALRLAPWVAAENITTAVGRVALLPLLAASSMGDGGLLGAAGLRRRHRGELADLRAGAAGPRQRPGHAAGAAPAAVLRRRRVRGKHLRHRHLAGHPPAGALAPRRRRGRLPDAALADRVGHQPGDVERRRVLRGRGRRRARASGSLLRRSLMLWAAIVAGAVIVCVAGARPLLGLVGARYAAHGVTLLRLIGLSCPFTALVILYSTLAWLDQKVWLLAAFQACAGALLMVAALLLLPRLGLTGIGWAYLGTQAAAAVAVTPFTVRRVRHGEFRRA